MACQGGRHQQHRITGRQRAAGRDKAFAGEKTERIWRHSPVTAVRSRQVACDRRQGMADFRARQPGSLAAARPGHARIYSTAREAREREASSRSTAPED